MDRIKNISKIIIGNYSVLAEIKYGSESKIIIPDESIFAEGSKAYCEVISVGKEVTLVKPGDIIMKFATPKLEGVKIGTKSYIITSVQAVSVAVTPDNFNKERKTKILTS